MTKQSASASVEVAADPATAFRIFTDEIDLWWVRGPINFFDAARAVGMQIEPGVGGRILEVYQAAGEMSDEDVLELGRITAWEPGSRLAYRSSVDDTETEIVFEPFDGGTRVSVEQALVHGGKKAFYFWPNVVPWFAAWAARRDSAPRTPRELDRLNVALYYEDPAAAARWLHTAFGLDSWNHIPAEGERPSWIELHVGISAILLFELKQPAPDPRPASDPRPVSDSLLVSDPGPVSDPRSASDPGPVPDPLLASDPGPVSDPRSVDHGVWIYVDDLDAHFARSSANGAKIVSEIHQHGYRYYEAEDLEGHRWTFAQARPTMH